MQITEKGTYELLESVNVRFNSTTAGSLSKGTRFIVKQIDKEYHKFYSDTFGDWQYWEKPVKKVDGA